MSTALAECPYNVTIKRGDLISNMTILPHNAVCRDLSPGATAQQMADFIADLYGTNVMVTVMRSYERGSCELA